MNIREMKVLMKKYCLIIFITLFAFGLRIYKVTTIPPSLSWDEVSIGYNAYSILKTGRDEHGRLFPIDSFIAYGDYKPPIAVYLTVPAVAIFGLNEFSVRLPSVIAGTLTILLTYFVVRQFFYLYKRKEALALIASMALAISPWHIQLSRAGFEANIALCFIVLGVLLTICSQTKARLKMVCWIPFVVAIYTFNSSRYFVPFLVLGLLVYFRKAFIKHRGYTVVGFIIALILFLPVVPHLLSPESRLRFKEVNIFTDLQVIQTSNNRIAYENNAWYAKILHNRRIGYLRSFLMHYFDHFDPQFLFIKGDGNPKFSIQDVGQLYLVEAPFLVFGILSLLTTNRSIALFLLFWLATAIIPAATARETPHALRIENTLPVWQIFIAYGLLSMKSNIKKGWIKRSFVIGCIVLYVGNISYYLHNYYSHYASEYSSEWQYGYREALAFIQPRLASYDSIVMTEYIGRAYMYSLFYLTYDPQSFWKTKNSSFDAAGFYHVYGFDKFHFTQRIGDYTSKTLYVATPGEVPKNARILKTINRLNGETVLVIFDV